MAEPELGEDAQQAPERQEQRWPAEPEPRVAARVLRVVQLPWAPPNSRRLVVAAALAAADAAVARPLDRACRRK